MLICVSATRPLSAGIWKLPSASSRTQSGSSVTILKCATGTGLRCSVSARSTTGSRYCKKLGVAIATGSSSHCDCPACCSVAIPLRKIASGNCENDCRVRDKTVLPRSSARVSVHGIGETGVHQLPETNVARGAADPAPRVEYELQLYYWMKLIRAFEERVSR